MSLSIDPKNGVRLKTLRKHGWGFAAGIVILEAVFSFFLYMSLAERVFVVTPASATASVPDLISYQGLLTDTSGNPLGGAGTVYCFQYSIWDVASGGTTSTDQLWPSPSVGNSSTTPTISTTTVVDGVFSDQLGRKDSLAGLDFESITTYYLQVAVNTVPSTCTGTWENLTPRQQIVSDAWSQSAQSVDGNLLRTVYTSTSTGMVYLGTGTGTVQIGTGLGMGWEQETLLSLDHVNASGSLSEYFGEGCNQDGTLWYDSTLKKAMVCENGTMDMISNATTTVAGIGATGTSTIFSNIVSLAAGANMTLSENGSTISFVGPSAGGGATLSLLDWPPVGAGAAVAISNSAASFVPINLAQSLNISKAYAVISYSGFTTTASNIIYSQNISIGVGLYTLNSTSATPLLSAISSASTIYSLSYGNTSGGTTVTNYANSTVSSLFNGVRRISVPLTLASAPPGNYWYGVWIASAATRNSTGATATTAFGTVSYMGANWAPTAISGNFSSATASSLAIMSAFGSIATAAMPGSAATNAIIGAGTSATAKPPYVIFTNF